MMTKKAALTCLRVIAFDEREPKYSIDIHVYIIIIYIQCTRQLCACVGVTCVQMPM